MIDVYIGLPLASSVTFLLALISICFIMVTVNEWKVVECELEHALLATSVTFVLVLIFICFIMVPVNDWKVVECDHEHGLLLSSFSFQAT